MIVFTGRGLSGRGLYSKIFNAHHEYNVRGLVGQLRALPGYYNAPSDLLADIRLRRAMMRTHLKGVDLAAFRDSSNPYVHFLDVMHEIDPNVRIVLGVRDGRDFARSGITRGYHIPDGRSWSGGVKSVARAVCKTFGYHLPGKHCGFGLQPEQCDPWFAEWPQMSPVEKLAWMWQSRNEKALTRLQSVPRDQWTVVRLEDLSGEAERGRAELQRLEEFLGIKGDPQWLTQKYNHSQSFGFPDKADWPEADIRSFYRIAGSTMEKLGYGTGPTPS